MLSGPYISSWSRSLSCIVWLGILCTLSACANQANQAGQTSEAELPETERTESIPIFVGNFEDDYGITYQISSSKWTQFPSSIYHLVELDEENQFLIAQNDSLNASAPGLWTRIDWAVLKNMPPYEWAFCLSAYEEADIDAARNAAAADKSVLKTGCGGHPFSRMKPASGAGLRSVPVN